MHFMSVIETLPEYQMPIGVHPDTLGLGALEAHQRSLFSSVAKKSLYDFMPPVLRISSRGEFTEDDKDYPTKKQADKQALEVRDKLWAAGSESPLQLEDAVARVVNYDDQLTEEYEAWRLYNRDNLRFVPHPKAIWLLTHVTTTNQISNTFYRFLNTNRRLTSDLQNDPYTNDLVAEQKEKWLDRTAELVDNKVLHPSVLVRNKRLKDTRVYIGDDFCTTVAGNGGYAPYLGNAVVVGRWAIQSASDTASTTIPHEFGHKIAWGGNVFNRLLGQGMDIDQRAIDEPLIQHLAEVIALGTDPDLITPTIPIYSSLKSMLRIAIDIATGRGADVSPSKCLYALSATGDERVLLQNNIDSELAGGLRLGDKPLRRMSESVEELVALKMDSRPGLSSIGCLEDAANTVALRLAQHDGRLPVNWN